MTKQELFNKVRDHLLAQGEPARCPIGMPVFSSDTKEMHPNSGAVNCAYRAPDGLKCAVGCLIPDDMYVPAMEGRSVSKLFRDWPQLVEAIGVEDDDSMRLLHDLQMIHDNREPAFWRDKLAELADGYGLES